jgi:hypothetical protein
MVDMSAILRNQVVSTSCLGLNSNPGGFGGSTLSILYGESCLLVSWYVGDRCDMTDSDEDCGRSRRPSVEDRDGQAQAGYSVAGRSRGRVMLCVVYTVHKETRSVRFFVEPQNKVNGLSVVWPQNH